MGEVHKAAMMGACAASTVALNVAMQQFSWGSAGEGGESGQNSEDDDYPPSLLADNMNCQFVALMSAEEEEGSINRERLFFKPEPSQWWDSLFAKPERWRALLRVSRPTFDYICYLVRRDMLETVNGQEMSVEKQVATALRRLSSGEDVSAVGELFGVRSGTVSKVTWRFVRAVGERARHHLKWPEGEHMERVKAGFEEKTGFKNCCGVLGSTHTRFLCPPEESSVQWLDRARNASMVSQAIVDTNLRFLDVCVGWPGASQDAHVLQNSTFYRLCEAGERLNGPAAVTLGTPVREYILGGVGHPLLPWLTTPFPEGTVTQDGRFYERTSLQSSFNKRHQAARGVADKAFVYLNGVWKMLCTPNRNPNTPKLSSLVFTCCLLHNILIDRGEVMDVDFQSAEHHDEGYSLVFADQFADSEGWKARDVLLEYLSCPQEPKLVG